MPPPWLCSTSTFPVDAQNAVKSGTEPGSVDSTSRLAPSGSSDSALRAFRTGSGQVKPLVSKILSGIGGLRYFVAQPISANPKRWQRLSGGTASACVGDGGGPRCQFETGALVAALDHRAGLGGRADFSISSASAFQVGWCPGSRNPLRTCRECR